MVLAKGLGADKVYYVRENQERFPGVTVERVFAREYKQGALAAHLFGNVGEVTAEQLKEPRYAGLEQGDLVGQSGIEYEYDRFLRGKAGTDRVQVDALGRPTRQLEGKPAEAGDNVRLTIDSDLQAYGESALNSFGLPGAFVVMNVEDGAVLAMASAPSFDPSIFTRPITQGQYRALTSRKTDAPLANRAIQGLYPTGSVFKPITATAALQDGLIDPNTIVNDTGKLKVDTVIFKNAGDAIFGPINMSDAFKVSSDIYFYLLGLKAKTNKGGGQIQDWARRLGLGEPTGIDLPAEVEGLVPNPSWRNRLYREGLTDRPWSAGDNINFAVGQGDLQADPLQMAVVYAAIANGGRVVRPHLAEQVESVTGQVLEEIRPAPKRQLSIDDGTRSTIVGGLTRAAMEEGGTSYPVFGNFPFPIAGKTGTAERGLFSRPVLVRGGRSRRQPRDRGRGDDRAGRLRCRLRGAGGRPDARELLQAADHSVHIRFHQARDAGMTGVSVVSSPGAIVRGRPADARVIQGCSVRSNPLRVEATRSSIRGDPFDDHGGSKTTTYPAHAPPGDWRAVQSALFRRGAARRRDRADRVQRLHPGDRHPRRHPRPAALLHAPSVDLRGDRDRADVRRRPDRLLAVPRDPGRDLLGDDRRDLPRPCLRSSCAWLSPLDRAPLLPLSALGARQGPPDSRPRRVRDRAHPPRGATPARPSGCWPWGWLRRH